MIFMTIYTDNKHDDYRFEYKKDHILVDKYYNQTKKFAPFTSFMCEPNLSEEEFTNICEKWYVRKISEDAARLAHKKAM